MEENNYDSLVKETYNNEPQEESYDNEIQESYAPKEQAFKASQLVAKEKEPERVSEALKISKEHNIPVDFAEQNLDAFKQEKHERENGYEAVVDKSPRLAKFMEDPVGSSLAKDDIETLAKVESQVNSIKPYEDRPSYVGDLARSAKAGVDHLGVSSLALAAAYNLDSSDEIFERMASLNGKIRNRKQPKYMEKFNEIYQEEGKDIGKAFSRFNDGFQKIKRDEILDGLLDYGKGAVESPAEIVDFIYEIVTKSPKGLGVSIANSAAFSLPSLVTGFAGGKAGGLGGGAVGSVIPGAGTAAGAAVGSTIGFFGGMFAGQVPTEVGAWIIQAMDSRGIDTTNPEALKAAYSDKAFLSEIRAEAERKGVTTALVDGMFSAFGMKYLKGAGKGLGARAVGRVKDVGVEAIGESVSEGAGQLAAFQGDFHKLDAGEIVFEGLAGLGTSVATSGAKTAATKTVEGAKKTKETIDKKTKKPSKRAEFSENPVDAAEEVSVKTVEAQQSLGEIKAVESLIDLAKESKLHERSPEKFKELLNDEKFGDAPQEVFFQKDEFDEFAKSVGESPVKLAEELLAMDSYNSEDGTGKIRVDMKEFVSKVASNDNYRKILEIATTKPDGINANEAIDHIVNLQDTIQEIAKEAETHQQRIKQTEEGIKAIREDLRTQIKDAGRNPMEAEAFLAFYRTIGFRENISPEVLYKRYGLNIKKADEVTDVEGDSFDQSPEARLQRAKEQGFDTDTTYFHGTSSEFDSFDLSKSRVGNFGKGFYFSSKKDLPKAFAGRDGKLIPTYLKGLDKLVEAEQTVTQEQLDIIEKNIDPEVLQIVKNNERFNTLNNLSAIFRMIARENEDAGISEQSLIDLSEALDITGFKDGNRGEVMIINPKNIRSVDAQFDPAKKDSSNIFYQSDKWKDEGVTFTDFEADPNNEGTFLITARDKDGNQIGQARFSESEDGFLIPDDKNYEVAVEVDEEHRRKGIASQLYTRAEKASGKPILRKLEKTGLGRAFDPETTNMINFNRISGEFDKIQDALVDEIGPFADESNYFKDDQDAFDNYKDLDAALTLARYIQDGVSVKEVEEKLISEGFEKGSDEFEKIMKFNSDRKSFFEKYADRQEDAQFSIESLEGASNDLVFKARENSVDGTFEGALELLKEERSEKIEASSKDGEPSRDDQKQIVAYDMAIRSVESHLGIKAESEQETVQVDPLQESVEPEIFEEIQAAAQTNDENRGRISFKNNSKFTIELFEKADKSTLFHEGGHYFLEVLKDLTSLKETSQELKDDFKSILEFLEVDSAEQIQTDQHEKFARAFEAYLREGKAPSRGLRRAFNTFKVWLMNVYKSVQDLNVEIDSSIRNVFDRMLATDEEIQSARGNTSKDPLIKDPIAAGMTKDQAERYKWAQAQSELDAQEKLLKDHMQDIEREEKKWWKDSLKKEKEAVAEQVNEIPVYKLMDSFKNKEGVKLNKKDLEEQFGSDIRKSLPRGATSGEGINHQMVASMFGFDSAQEMVDALIAAPDKNTYIEQTAIANLREEHGDMLTNSEIEDIAQEYVHNEFREKRLRMEYEFLASNNPTLMKDITKRVTSRPAPDAQMRDQAQREVDKLKVEEIKPNVYRLAERRHAREAGRHLAEKNIEAAFLSKQNELLAHYMYKFSLEAKKKIKSNIDFSKKFFEKDDKLAKTRDMDFISSGRAILARYGLGRSDKTPLEQLEKIKEYNPDSYENLSAIITGLVKDPDNYNKISYGQFTDLMDGLKALWSLSKDQKEVEINGKKVKIEEAAAQLNDQLDIFIKKGNKEKYQKTATEAAKLKKGLLGIKAQLIRFENWVDTMDLGEITGPFRTFLYEGISKATTEFYNERAKTKKKFIELSDKVKKDIDLKKPIVSDEIGFEFKNKGELLGAMLHTGNGSNKRKLLVGRGWADLDESGQMITQRWDAFIDRMHDEGVLTAADYEYLQGVWDLMESIKPKAQQAHKKLMGYYFDEITADEIETPFGTFKGGYAPAVVDPMAVQSISDKNELENFIKGNAAFMLPHSGGKGFTKGRVEFNKPLNLDIGLVAKHIDDVLRFAIVKPAVVDAYKVLTNKEFENKLGEYDSEISTKMIKPAYNRADKDKRIILDPTGSSLIWKWANALKVNSSIQLMAGNVRNTIEQFAGITIAATRISPKYLARASAAYMMNSSEVTKLMQESSTFMNTRNDDQMFEIEKVSRDIFSEQSGFQKMKDFAMKHAYFLQIFQQNHMEKVIWSASYNESVASGMTHDQAVQKADSDIRQTQGSRRPMDISRVETNPFMNVFQMFMNFFNMLANLNVSNFQKLYYSDMKMSEKVARGIYLQFMGFASVAIISEALRKVAAGSLDEDDDDEIADDIFEIFVGSQIELATAMVPGAGPALQAGINWFNDKPFDDRVSASPAVNAVTAVVGVTGKAFNGDLWDDKSVNKDRRDALNALGIVSGIPLYPLSKPINYLSDVEAGKARPKGPIDFTRGLVTGKPGNK